MIVMSLMLGVTSVSKGQPEPSPGTPDKFHGYVLGTPLSNFAQKNLKNSEPGHFPHFSSIKTTGMLLYTLKNQLTEGGDKIDIDFLFYKDSLSVIRVAYKERQLSQELLEALKSRYGDFNRHEDDIYTDPSSGASGMIRNLYWEKWNCCILNLTSTDGIGLVYITFAAKADQVKINDQDVLNKQKRIN